MQTQWSTGADDGNGGVGGGPTSAGPEAVAADAAVEAVPADAAAEAAVESAVESAGQGAAGPAGEATRVATGAATADATTAGQSASGDAGSADVLVESPADGSEGEEEAHRSAVDAVDALLDEVELALARLDDGTYGRCEECGAQIDDARLADSPIERTCGTCVIGGSGAVEAVTGPLGHRDVAHAPVAPAGLSAATGHHGG